MHIVGIEHDLEYVSFVYKFLHASHPQGIKSIMLELSPKLPLPDPRREMVNYFEIFERLMLAGKPNIIRGDIYDGSSIRKRNKGLAAMIKEFSPEVVLVGRGHGDYLKRKFPDAHYSALESETLSKQLRSFSLAQRMLMRIILDASPIPTHADQYLLMHKCPGWHHDDCSLSSVKPI